MKMTSKKNILYKANLDDNDESDPSMAPCFQVNPNAELKDIPTNGEEFLTKTINERKGCVTVTHTTIDISQFAPNQSRFVQEIKNAPAPESLLPTKEWQIIQVADFSDIRMYISRLRAKKHLWPKDFTVIDFHVKINDWKYFFENKEPTLSSVFGLKQIMLDRGLECLIERLNDIEPGLAIDYKTGQWIYSFLACIRQPLLSDTISILRTLARKCAEIRSHFDEEDEYARMNVMPLNLFICLVSRYFGQYDLADPYPPKAIPEQIL